MIEMKKHIVLAALFGVSSLIGWATPFTILFTDGAQMRIHKVEPITDSFESWNKNSNMLKGMFYTYNFPSDLAAYKSVFYKNGYPDGIDTVYATWRPKMNTITITPQAIFYGLLDGVEVACIQYFYQQHTDQIQMSFLAKRVEGKWYPIGSVLMAKYQTVMALMATLQPELVAKLLAPDPKAPTTAAAPQLKETCMDSNQTITESCIYSLAEKWGMSGKPIDQEKENQLFKKRMHRDIPPTRRASIDQALSAYVLSLEVPEEGARRALYYFSKNENMKAIWLLRAYGLAIDNNTLFSALNQIQETTQYKSMNFPPKETPKAN
jgi:hypothetical protein